MRAVGRPTVSGSGASSRTIGVVACGAIAPELRQIIDDTDATVVLDALPASLHNRPEHIEAAVRARVAAFRQRGISEIIVGYADCGTSGALDRLCIELGVQRLPGPHCYALFAGKQRFAELQDAQPGTFYLTDYLARNFRRLVAGDLGLERHPQLRDVLFANYTRVVYLQQSADPDLRTAAEDAADFLGLPLDVIDTGLRPFAQTWQRVQVASATEIEPGAA